MASAESASVTPIRAINHLSTQRMASPADVEKLAEKWPVEFLKCRTNMHNWEEYNCEVRDNGVTLVEVLRCSVCASEKRIEMSNTGWVRRDWIDYSEGYLSAGLGRISGDSRAILRMEKMARLYDIGTSKKKDGKVKRKRSA